MNSSSGTFSPAPTQQPADGQSAQTEKGMWKVALASSIGTTIEYYDFVLYAFATALVFNKTFFPSTDPLVGSLAAFVTFFVGYCARPLGGMIFGHFGDRIGRKTALVTTVLIMGIGTFAIGLVPTYDSIGIWAPVLLVLLRTAQGIGIGGEYGGGMTMAIEHAPRSKRGFYSALVHVGVPAGLVLPVIFLSGLSAWMGEESFMAWGWRIPFLGSIVMLAIGLFIRFQIDETPAFEQLQKSGNTAKAPLLEALRNPKNILFGIGSKIAESGFFNIYAVFAITYGVTKLGIPKQVILNGVLYGALVECFTLPFFGWLSDKVGRRKVYIGGLVFQACLALPFYAMLDTREPAMIYLAIGLGLAIGHGMVFGAQGALYSELFPARIRYSGLSLVQQIGPILGGGLSPLLATTLLAEFGGVPTVIAYMVLMAAVSAVCTLALRPQAD